MKNKRKWLQAIREMRGFYQGKHGHGFCSFCNVVEGNCEKCLWRLYGKQNCVNYAKKKFKGRVQDLKWDRNKRWVADSLKRLDRWEKRIKSENP